MNRFLLSLVEFPAPYSPAGFGQTLHYILRLMPLASLSPRLVSELLADGKDHTQTAPPLTQNLEALILKRSSHSSGKLLGINGSQ